MNWLKQLFADGNGVPDDARIAAFLIVLTYCGNSIFAVIRGEHHSFDMQAYGIGAGAMVAGVGALFGLRKGN